TEHASEILALVRQNLGKCRFAMFLAVGQNQFAHGVNAIAFKEHMLGAAQSNASRAERDGVSSLFWGVGVGADLHPRYLGAPVHQLLEVLIRLALFAVERFLDQY